MTVNRGLLLFDAPERPVGKWENQLGYRGLKEVWKIPSTPYILEIDFDDGYEPAEGAEDDAGWEGRWPRGRRRFDKAVRDLAHLVGRS